MDVSDVLKRKERPLSFVTSLLLKSSSRDRFASTVQRYVRSILYVCNQANFASSIG